MRRKFRSCRKHQSRVLKIKYKNLRENTNCNKKNLKWSIRMSFKIERINIWLHWKKQRPNTNNFQVKAPSKMTFNWHWWSSSKHHRTSSLQKSRKNKIRLIVTSRKSRTLKLQKVLQKAKWPICSPNLDRIKNRSRNSSKTRKSLKSKSYKLNNKLKSSKSRSLPNQQNWKRIVPKSKSKTSK